MRIDYRLLFPVVLLYSSCKNLPESPEYQIPKPVIQWRDTIVDLGTVAAGERKTATFHFRNVGDTQLHIYKIEATCSCTSIQQSTSKQLQSGYEDSIVANIHIPDDTGLQVAKVYVLSDALKKFQVLKINSYVVKSK